MEESDSTGLRLNDIAQVHVFTLMESYETLDKNGDAHTWVHVRRFGGGRWEGFTDEGLWAPLSFQENQYLEKQFELFRKSMV